MINDPVAGATDAERLEHLRSADEDLKNSAGNNFSIRISSFQRIVRSWNGFAVHFHTLLEYCESDAEASSQLARNFGDRSMQDRLILALDQSILAYTSGLCAVVDQARIVARKYLNDTHQREFSEKNEEIKSRYPYGFLFAKLRNHLLHSLSAPWVATAFLDSGTGSIGLETDPLLNNSRIDGTAKELLRDAGGTISIRRHIRPHLEAMLDHCEWLANTAIGDQADIIQAYDQLVERRNLILTAGAYDGRGLSARVASLERQIAERRSREGDDQAR